MLQILFFIMLIALNSFFVWYFLGTGLLAMVLLNGFGGAISVYGLFRSIEDYDS